METKLDKSNKFIKSLGNFLSHFDLNIKHYIKTIDMFSKQHNDQRDEPNLCFKQRVRRKILGPSLVDKSDMYTKLDKSNNFIKSLSNFLSHLDLYRKHYVKSKRYVF